MRRGEERRGEQQGRSGGKLESCDVPLKPSLHWHVYRIGAEDCDWFRISGSSVPLGDAMAPTAVAWHLPWLEQLRGQPRMLQSPPDHPSLQ